MKLNNTAKDYFKNLLKMHDCALIDDLKYTIFKKNYTNQEKRALKCVTA